MSLTRGAGQEGPTAGPLAPQSKPELQQTGLPQFKLQDLDMQIQDSQKATQWVHEMNLTGAHMQTHLYRIKVTSAQSGKHRPITQSDKVE